MMDLFSRKIIAWNISTKLDGVFVKSTFQKVYESRIFPKGLMFHPGRGTQCTAVAFKKFLDIIGVVQSFSKKVYPFDNAYCESFLSTSKKRSVTAEPTKARMSWNSRYFNTLMDFTTQKERDYYSSKYHFTKLFTFLCLFARLWSINLFDHFSTIFHNMWVGSPKVRHWSFVPQPLDL